MTAEERQRLKDAIDARKRELVVDDGRKYYNREDCVSCGVRLSEYTPGCRRCRDRELKLRRRRGWSSRRPCASCGGEIDNFTSGCEVCQRRRRKRAARARERVAA